MVRPSSLPKLTTFSLNLFLGAITLALLTSCTQNKGDSTVEITIPDFSKHSLKVFSQSVSAQSGGEEWGLADPSGIAEFGCFGIFVGADDSGLNTGKAFGVNGNLLLTFGISKGLVGPGGTISLTVPSGTKRTITLIGMALANGATCEPLTNENHEITGQNYSAPFILAQTTVDLMPGNSPPVTMKASYNQATSVKLDEVEFPGSGSGGGGGGGSIIFLGSGSDGDITVSGNVSLSDLDNATTTRKLSTSAQVISIARPDPANYPNKFSVGLTGTIATFNGTHFNVGDEVLMYISAASNSNGCGPNVWPGFRMGGKVLSAPSANVIDVTFGDVLRVSTIPNANLVNTVASPSFCRVSIIRIPQINKLTFTDGANLKMLPFSGHGTFSEGGLMILRVKDRIVLNASASASIDMSSSGYLAGQSSSKPGEGEQGHPLAISLVSNGAGGGGGDGATYAGGGGHGTSGLPGLGGSNAGAQIGDQYGCNEVSPNNFQHCLFGKIFMGGGGGSYGGLTTGNGGGVISIFTNNIIVGAGETLNIYSNGGTGNSSGGGGAGGAVLIRTLNLQVAGAANSLALSANGGGSSGNHGAGSGGRVHLDVVNSCSVAPSSVSATVNGGTSHATATAGTVYVTGNASASCPLPATSPAL